MKNNLLDKNIRIFVFGTLRKGGRLDYYMEGSEYLGKFYTRGQLMESPTSSAYIDFEQKDAATIGELYDIDFYCLQRIDHLESNWGEFPKGYEIGLISVWPYNNDRVFSFEPETQKRALVYFMKEAKIVRSGDWQNKVDVLEQISRILKMDTEEKDHNQIIHHLEEYLTKY